MRRVRMHAGRCRCPLRHALSDHALSNHPPSYRASGYHALGYHYCAAMMQLGAVGQFTMPLVTVPLGAMPPRRRARCCRALSYHCCAAMVQVGAVGHYDYGSLTMARTLGSDPNQVAKNGQPTTP